MSLEVTVRATGPLFDGRAQRAVEDYLRAATAIVADEGAKLVVALGHSQYRDPTGFYASRVVTDRASDGTAQVTDSGVVYGPWLEGLSSRNHTTPFKGYATFRRAAGQLDRRADQIAKKVLPPYLRRMNQ